MKKLSRNEMKNLNGGNSTEETIDDGNAGCAPETCTLNQAACVFAGHSGKACSTGTGSYNWKCCK